MKTVEFGFDDIQKLQKHGITGLDACVAQILIGGVPQAYHPAERVLAIAAACGRSSYEGSIIRAFHSDRYHLESDKVIVVGCDNREQKPSHQDYDFHLSSTEGDVRFADPWEKGLIFASNGKQRYDFVLINFPPIMIETNPWLDIIERSLQFLSDDGVVAITGMDADIPHLSRLQEILSGFDGVGLTPVQHFRYNGRLVVDYGLLCAQKGE